MHLCDKYVSEGHADHYQRLPFQQFCMQSKASPSTPTPLDCICVTNVTNDRCEDIARTNVSSIDLGIKTYCSHIF